MPVSPAPVLLAASTADPATGPATAPRSPWSEAELLPLLLGRLAAFSAYFAMYAFRKPLTVSTYSGVGLHPFGLDYKSALVIMQVAGYAVSKFFGIRIISGFGRHGRAAAIAGLIGGFTLCSALCFVRRTRPGRPTHHD